MRPRYFWLFFVLVCLVASFFRFFLLGNIPGSLYWDEAAILVDARLIAETGKDMHGNSWLQPIFLSYGDYKLPVLIWLAALSVKVLGVSELALRLPSALAGLGTVVVAFFLVSELKFLLPKDYKIWKLQLAAASIVATSFWSIQFSRTGFEGHIAQLFLAISLLFAFKARKHPLWFVISALVGVVAVYTYFSVRFVWPPLFLLAAGMSILPMESFGWNAIAKGKKQIIARTGVALTSVLLFFICLLPMFKSQYYAASQQFRLSSASILQNEKQILTANRYRELAGNTMLDRLYFHRDLFTLQALLENYAQHLSPEYIFFKGDANLRHGTGRHGLFASVLLLPLIVGLYLLAKQAKLLVVFLVSWWLISLLPASVPLEVPHALRSLNALVPISLVIAYGIVALVSSSDFFKKALFFVFCLILALQMTQYWHYYLTFYPKESSLSWQGGYKQLAQAVTQQKNIYRTVWVNYHDPRLYLWFLMLPEFSAEQIQTTPKENYQMTTIDNIYFESYDYSRLPTLDHKVLVIDSFEEGQQRLKDLKNKPYKTEVISDSYGKPVFFLQSFDIRQ